mmetsp:Transcript_15694/g.28177  ORF Transcript_15694/g.28177 Transcript_15694/m.28177 type:complete len:365 (+) Transcript_15694:240-1334(+)|eukprot:CAMPEP_0197543800 /NCGR_PEP_ID=MMETSP1318-20131121/68435_1 /TAXON_ID=552666 /ORGANISM="Partenskyella glossopodia, Strain RCC365" /LENGTH=364 /DNA_ID=CAMNT_0043103163 /DNA_START=152 /DNA_END=1246 /DNA_ORIENTATION=-
MDNKRGLFLPDERNVGGRAMKIERLFMHRARLRNMQSTIPKPFTDEEMRVKIKRKNPKVHFGVPKLKWIPPKGSPYRLSKEEISRIENYRRFRQSLRDEQARLKECMELGIPLYRTQSFGMKPATKTSARRRKKAASPPSWKKSNKGNKKSASSAKNEFVEAKGACASSGSGKSSASIGTCRSPLSSSSLGSPPRTTCRSPLSFSTCSTPRSGASSSRVAKLKPRPPLAAKRKKKKKSKTKRKKKHGTSSSRSKDAKTLKSAWDAPSEEFIPSSILTGLSTPKSTASDDIPAPEYLLAKSQNQESKGGGGRSFRGGEAFSFNEQSWPEFGQLSINDDVDQESEVRRGSGVDSILSLDTLESSFD